MFKSSVSVFESSVSACECVRMLVGLSVCLCVCLCVCTHKYVRV